MGVRCARLNSVRIVPKARSSTRSLGLTYVREASA